MTHTPDFDTLRKQLIDLSRQAGDAILNIYAQEFDVVTKDDDSPLTQADLASHRIIVKALEALTPEIPVLSEESAEIPFETRQQWSRYWLIDPLDGTKEFINRNGEFTVNIALIDSHAPVLGVVHVPVQGKTYSGIVGMGAWRQTANTEEQRISVRQPTPDQPVVVGSRSHANPKLIQCLAGIGDYEMVSMGSSLKFCHVAEGSADLYPRLGLTSEWDTAAAQAVVEGAGGQVLGLEGEPLPYNRKDSYLNPWFVVVGNPEAGWMERLDTDL
jgi:3'(2'), 5'-bisphosphate nucleotidase